MCLQDAIKYLMYVIRDNGNKDAAIHNYMLSLLAKSKEDSGRLLDFIESQCADGQPPVFDLKYALRVCAREGRDRYGGGLGEGCVIALAGGRRRSCGCAAQGFRGDLFRDGPV